ncbi:MAG: diaminopimelate epimerase [Deltaproteobacteria bacterium]|nr:diaminopimelate epimerase [Deltaproteobacteria bacterium]
MSGIEKNSLSFWKMQGGGNDFIVIDNRGRIFPEKERFAWVRRLCRRALGVGADGLILVEEAQSADFTCRIYNADGSEAEMCGNGGRCVARFAFLQGIAQAEMVFLTPAGAIRARVDGDRVKLEMTRPHSLRQGLELEIEGERIIVDFINSGVPHVVLVVDREPDSLWIRRLGVAIRRHPAFAPAGTNVNFVRILDEQRLAIRTYERGVEAETLACGTGSVAAALLLATRGKVVSPTAVVTGSGEILTIFYKREGLDFSEVFLEGGAVIVYKGVLELVLQPTERVV